MQSLNPRKRSISDIVNPVAFQPIARRRLHRPAATGFKHAFQLLKGNNLHGFLNHWMVRRDLAPAFDLLKNFGQGHREATVTALWHLHWRGDLFVREVCCVCNLGRSLKYGFYLNRLDDQEDGEMQLLGLMETHCYEIKFRPLMLLADVCLGLLGDLHRDDFDQHARETLAKALESMREIY